MRRTYFAACLVLFAVFIGVVGLVFLSQQQPVVSFQSYEFDIIAVFPHDQDAFTQGLAFDGGNLYEGTGLLRKSELRQVDLETGDVLQRTSLSDNYFGEGIAVAGDFIVQLTWQNHIGFVYGKQNLGLLGEFNYSTEGWGITFDGEHLIMSDGTEKLYFLDPATFQVVGQINVFDGNSSVIRLNELEYVKGDILANVWLTGEIAIINPQTGQVKGWLELGDLEGNSTFQANGIAYDAQGDRLFITGKNWSHLYEIKIKTIIS